MYTLIQNVVSYMHGKPQRMGESYSKPLDKASGLRLLWIQWDRPYDIENVYVSVTYFMYI